MASRQKTASRKHHLCGIDTKKAYFFLPDTRRYFFWKRTFPYHLLAIRGEQKNAFLWNTGRLWPRVRRFWRHLPGMDRPQKTAF